MRERRVRDSESGAGAGAGAGARAAADCDRGCDKLMLEAGSVTVVEPEVG